MRQLLCRFLGHEVTDFTDGGYDVCARCGSHSYWNVDEWSLKWVYPPLRWYWQALSWWWQWKDNREIARRLKGIENGNEDDLPF